MAFGRLASHTSGSAGTYAVYEVPTGKVFKGNVSVVDSGTVNTEIHLYVSPTSTPANDYVIQKDTLTPTNSGYERTALILKAGEWVCYQTDSATTQVVVYGILEDSVGDDFSGSALISTNTDTTIYANGSAKDTSLNISISLTDGAVTDTAVVELYVTTTNVAGGYLIQKETLRVSSTTGFERAGLAISAADKLIIRTTLISGTVAVRVNGFIEV